MDAGQDEVLVEISTDGATWDPVVQFGGGTDATWQSYSSDISAWIDTDTRIRFTAVSMTQANDHFYVDDFRIELTSAASSPVGPLVTSMEVPIR